ncbi:MAG: hypothetical protein H0X24_20815 [Ktedonobacterales bacterium]|nr:hypothetical protein [Ktedonobacterales bacterium]
MAGAHDLELGEGQFQHGHFPLRHEEERRNVLFADGHWHRRQCEDGLCFHPGQHPGL